MKQPLTLEQELANYEMYLDMFKTEGWKKFIKVNTEQLKTERKDAHITKTTNDVWQEFRGYVSLMEKILAFEESVGTQIDIIKEELSDKKSDSEDTSDFDND